MNSLLKVFTAVLTVTAVAGALGFDAGAIVGFDSYAPGSSGPGYGFVGSVSTGRLGFGLRAMLLPREETDESVGSYYDGSSREHWSAGASFTYALTPGTGGFSLGADYAFSSSLYSSSEGRSFTFWDDDDYTREDHRILLTTHYTLETGLFEHGPNIDIWSGIGPAIVKKDGAKVHYGSRPDDLGDWTHYEDFISLDVGMGVSTIWGITSFFGIITGAEMRYKTFEITGDAPDDVPAADLRFYVGPAFMLDIGAR